MNRSRFTPDLRAVVRLTARDREILAELFASRLLSRDQLIALGYFTSVSRANRALRRLFDARMVRRIYPEIGAFGTPAVYGIGPQAALLIAARFGIEKAEVLRLAHREVAGLQISHTLGVNSVRVLFIEAARELGWSVRFTPEWRARHEYSFTQGGRVQERILKPDAFFRLTTAFGTLSYFLEWDMGHVSRPQWSRTVAHYEEHAKRGLLKSAFGVEHCPILTITTGGALRLKHLLEAAPRGSSRFLFTTETAIKREGIFGPIWRSRASADPQPLLAPPNARYQQGEK